MALTYEDIAQEFKNKVDSDPKVQQYLKTIRSGNGTYVTANKLAVRVGEDLGKVLKMHEPIDGISEWDYVDLIPKALGLDQQMVVDACREVQEDCSIFTVPDRSTRGGHSAVRDHIYRIALTVIIKL